MRERITVREDNLLEYMYMGLGIIGEGFEAVIKIATAPFILQAKLLDSLSEYLGGGFDPDDRFQLSLRKQKGSNI